MSFCFLCNIVSENHSVQNSPWGGGGSIASSRSKRVVPRGQNLSYSMALSSLILIIDAFGSCFNRVKI